MASWLKFNASNDLYQQLDLMRNIVVDVFNGFFWRCLIISSPQVYAAD